MEILNARRSVGVTRSKACGTRSIGRVALGIALLCGISSCGQSDALAGWSDETAAIEITAQLQRKSFNLGEQHYCSEWFEVGKTTVTDVSYPGGSGLAAGVIVEVKTSTPVRAKEAVMAGARLAELCYGWPYGGYAAGQTSNYLHTFAFRRWRSGWQLLDQQQG